jgi:hypothetical protein
VLVGICEADLSNFGSGHFGWNCNLPRIDTPPSVTVDLSAAFQNFPILLESESPNIFSAASGRPACTRLCSTCLPTT